MSLLLARRLVEAGVPFVTVFWKEDEGLVAEQVQERRRLGHARQQLQLPEGPPAAGVRSRLFGADRRPGTSAACSTRRWCWSPAKWAASPRSATRARGGVSGGGPRPLDALPDRRAGRRRHSRRPDLRLERPLGEYPADNPVTPADIAKTVYHAMGIDDLEARDREGRPLQPAGRRRTARSLF